MKLIILLLIFNFSYSFILGNNQISKVKNKDFNYECSNWNGQIFNTLIFKGGGTRAIVYTGAIKRLEEEQIIKEIKYLAGTSSGAQTAALVCCGYNSEDIHNIIILLPWEKILDTGFLNIKGVYNLLKNYGYYNSNYLNLYLEELLFNKTNINNITFKNLYEISNIHLKVGVCSLTDRKFKYLDYKTYPDMPVSLGLTASSSIPFVFSYTKWKSETFIDGGLVGNLPTTAFPENKCLAFNLIGYNEIESKLNKNPKNIIDFIKMSFSILYNYAQEMISPKNKKIDNIDFIEIYSDKIGLLDINLNKEFIKKTINCGYDAVDEFLKCKK